MDIKPDLIAVQLELTNRCALDCDECARRHMTRPLGDMSWELATKLCDEAIEAGAGIVPSGLGEPLLWTDFPDLMRYIEAASPSTHLTIYTSLVAGQGLRDEFQRAVRGYGGRILVGITLHYAQGTAMGYAQWNPYEQTAHDLLNLNDEQREVHVALQPTASEYDRLRFASHFGPNGLRVHTDAPTIQSWFGLVNDRNDTTVAPNEMPGSNEPCHRPFSDTFMVLCDGRCVGCCQDVISDDPGDAMPGPYVAGDANTTPLMDIWHGDRMVELRQAQLDKDVAHISPCNTCRDAPTREV